MLNLIVLIQTETSLNQFSKVSKSKLDFAPRLETFPVPAQYQIFTVKTSKMEGMNNVDFSGGD